MADAPEQSGFRRRIDRVSAADYLAGVEERPPAELRAMRDDCREEEGRLSYARRLLQGRLDIVRAELVRRAGGDPSLLESLPKILADRARGRTDQAHALNSPVLDFPEVGGRGEESLIRDASVGRLPELSDEDVAELQRRLEAEEERVSNLRRTVLDHLDRLQSELVARYRDGSADLHEVVAGVAKQMGPSDEDDAG